MANYIENITTPGQGLVSSLNGEIQIEESQGRLVIYDPITNQPLNIIDRDGQKTYNGSADEVVRSGKMPDNSYGFTAAKPGETIQTIYG